MEEYEEFEKQFGEFIDDENPQKKSKWILFSDSSPANSGAI